MPYLIGTDEAGYGPNLGPLVISATVVEVAAGQHRENLYERLAEVIAAVPGRAGRRNPAATDAPADRVAWADSKVLYQSGKGLRLLERGLWAAFGLLGPLPRSGDALWQLLAPECQARCELPEAACYDSVLPLEADLAEIEVLGPRLVEQCAAACVRLASMASRVVFPAEFNDAVDHQGSKGSALSRWTLELVSRTIARLPEGPICVVCDKHGGRDHYLPLLMEFFPDFFIEVHGEGRQQSVYRFGPPERRMEIVFQAKGESHLPTALASMASKYLRELAMRALNRFWCERVAGLEPTAGYPADAVRFRAQIAAAQDALGIKDRTIWRMR